MAEKDAQGSYPALAEVESHRVHGLSIDDEFVVGRSSDVNLPVLDMSCSRQQFRIRHAAGTWLLEAISEKVTTYYDRRAVDTPVSLSHGKLIQAGSSKFCFLEYADDAAVDQCDIVKVEEMGTIVPRGESGGVLAAIDQEEDFNVEAEEPAEQPELPGRRMDAKQPAPPAERPAPPAQQPAVPAQQTAAPAEQPFKSAADTSFDPVVTPPLQWRDSADLQGELPSRTSGAATAAGSVLSFAKQSCLRTAGHLRDLFLLIVETIRGKWLRRSVRPAEIQAGAILAKRKIGTPELLSQIVQIDERIENLKNSGASTRSVLLERRGLLRRLYRASSEQGIAGVADVRETHVQAVEIQLDENRKRGEHLRSSVFPSQREHFAQLAGGYLLLAIVILSGFWLSGSPEVAVTSSAVIASVTDERVSGAIGLVVAGAKVVYSDGTVNEIPFGTGSCFAVSSAGFLLTNRHVVEEFEKLKRATLKKEKLEKQHLIQFQEELWVFLNQKKYTATVVFVDDEFDLAILKVDRPDGPYFQLHSRKEVPRAAPVLALGYPGAAGVAISQSEIAEATRREKEPGPVEKKFKPRDLSFSVTKGSVSRFFVEENGHEWLQHDADINPGNSGGPLMTEAGLVVGINTLGNTEAQGIYFALTFEQLRKQIAEHVPGVEFEELSEGE